MSSKKYTPPKVSDYANTPPSAYATSGAATQPLDSTMLSTDIQEIGPQTPHLSPAMPAPPSNQVGQPFNMGQTNPGLEVSLWDPMNSGQLGQLSSTSVMPEQGPNNVMPGQDPNTMAPQAPQPAPVMPLTPIDGLSGGMNQPGTPGQQPAQFQSQWEEMNAPQPVIDNVMPSGGSTPQPAAPQPAVQQAPQPSGQPSMGSLFDSPQIGFKRTQTPSKKRTMSV